MVVPRSGENEKFQLFMAPLDADRIAGRPRGGARNADLSGLMPRLTGEEPVRSDGSPLFPERCTHTVSRALSPCEGALYEAVTAGYARG